MAPRNHPPVYETGVSRVLSKRLRDRGARWRWTWAGAVLLVAACGGGNTAGQSPTTTTQATATSQPATSLRGRAVDSCSAITQAEAGAALGETVKAPVQGRAAVEGGVACVYYGPNAPAGADADAPVPDSVRVVLVNGADARSFFDDYRAKVTAQTVSGLGDQAYYDGVGSLSVLKGSAYLRVAVIGVADALTAEKTLASYALARI